METSPSYRLWLWKRGAAVAAAFLLLVTPAAGDVVARTKVIQFNDDGGWCWFQDERVVVHDGKLVIGSVASGRHDPARRGSVECVAYGLESGEMTRVVLHERLQYDDHASPAFVVRGDGRLLAMYTRHGNDNRVYYRVTDQPGDISRWRPAQVFVPSERSRVTYSNPLRLSSENDNRGRLYNFFRGYNDSFKPSWMTSDDDGETWTARGVWIDLPVSARHRPYVKYVSDGRGAVHFAFTEGHPRNFDNSIYHAVYRDGAFHRSDGARIKAVVDGPVTPGEATRVFRGDASSVAWISDVELDDDGHPVLVYSVQKDAAGLRPAHPDAGKDHRYRYARWDGRRWHDHEVAFAGSRLYAGEDDYTGLICIDPDRPGVVYLSSNVDPRTGQSVGGGHYEIYRGETKDLGRSWSWRAITQDSAADNIRPIVPRWRADRTALLWLRGAYRSYTDYDLEVVGIIGEAED